MEEKEGSEKMRICVISFGPIKSRSNGYFVRVWNILKEISRSNEVIVLEFPETKTNKKVIKHNNITFIRLRGNETISNRILNQIKKILTFEPFHSFKFQIFSFIELWKHKKVISQADIVMIGGCLIPAGNIIAKLLRKKVILDTHCINKLLARKFKKKNVLIYFLRTFLWDILERLTIRLSDIIITVSEKEKEFVTKEYKVQELKVFVVPNIIEPPKKIPKERIENLRKKLGLKDKIIVTFLGNLESVQNADAVEYIINELAPWFWKKRKDVVFLIIGKGNEKFNCNLPNVMFTGFVEDLAPYLAISDICIAPLRVGGGTKTKILEYIVYGKPVITSTIGIEGLESFVSFGRIKVASIDMFKHVLLKTINKGNYEYIDEKFNLNNNLLKMFKENLHRAIRA